MDIIERFQKHFNKDVYARLHNFKTHIGFIAIRNIPKGKDPFLYVDNEYLYEPFTPLLATEIPKVNDNVQSLLQLFYDEENKIYWIPFNGLISMYSLMYIKRGYEYNLAHNIGVNCGLTSWKTTRMIVKGEELIVDRFSFENILRKHDSALDKISVIKNIQTTFCKLDISDHGVGVFAIIDIPANIKIFTYTKDGFLVDIVLVDKDFIINDIGVKKMFTDYFIPNKFNARGIPKHGINHLEAEFFMNHSHNPNVKLNTDNCFYSTKMILQGEELLLDYESLNPRAKSIMGFDHSEYL